MKVSRTWGAIAAGPAAVGRALAVRVARPHHDVVDRRRRQSALPGK